MNREEAFGPFANLQAQIEEIAQSLGLSVARFMIDPPDKIHIIFAVEAEAVLSEYEKEQRKVDLTFAQMEREFEEDGIVESKMEIIRKDIAEWMDKKDD